MFLDNFALLSNSKTTLNNDKSKDFSSSINGDNKNSFQNTLKKILNNKDIKKETNINNVKTYSASNIENLDTLNPKELLNKLLQKIQTNNEEYVFIDKKSLDDFQNLLIKIGFSSFDVKKFISKIKNEIGDDNTINLTTLIEDAKKLEVDEDAFANFALNKKSELKTDKDDVFISIANLPFLSSIIKAVISLKGDLKEGLKENDIKNICNSSIVKGKGINLNTFINETKKTLIKIDKNFISSLNNSKNSTDNIQDALNNILAQNDNTQISTDNIKDALNNILAQNDNTQISTDNIKDALNNILAQNDNKQKKVSDLYKTEIKEVLSSFLGKVKIKQKEIKQEDTTIEKSMKLTSELNTTKIASFAKVEESKGVIKKDVKNNIGIKIDNNLTKNINNSFEQKIPTQEIMQNILKQKEILDTNFSEQEDFVKTFQDILSNSVSTKKETLKNLDKIKKTNQKDATLDFAEENIKTEKTNIRAASSSKAGNTSPKTTEDLLPPYVVRQMNRQLLKAINNNLKEISFQLKPANLGKIKLSIDSTKDGLKVSVLTEQKNTKEILNSNELKTILTKQGVDVKSVDIDMAFNFEQSMARQMQNNFNNKKQNKNTTIIDNIKTGETTSNKTEESFVKNSINENGDISFFV